MKLPGSTYQSGANTAAVHGLVDDSGVAIELRQSKYLNNLIEQDHRAVKRRTRPMLQGDCITNRSFSVIEARPLKIAAFLSSESTTRSQTATVRPTATDERV